jgi:hypothetical protein
MTQGQGINGGNNLIGNNNQQTRGYSPSKPKWNKMQNGQGGGL